MNLPDRFLTVQVNHCRGRFQTRTFGQLFHPSSSRPRFQQLLTTRHHLLKCHVGNRTPLKLSIFGRMSDQMYYFFREGSFDELCTINLFISRNDIERFYQVEIGADSIARPGMKEHRTHVLEQ